MEHHTLPWWDYSLFFIVIGLSTLIGIYHGYYISKKSTAADYFFGGVKMKVIPVLMSLIASSFSGTILLGFPADVYLYGTQVWILVLSFIVVGLIINFVYLPVFYEMKLSSAYYYLEIRFNRIIRRMVSLVYVVMIMMETPVLVYTYSLAFSQVTRFNLHAVAFTASLICMFYTTIGGFKAVIWTDVLQLAVTLCTLVFIFTAAVISVGGFKHIWTIADSGSRIEFFNINPDPTLRTTFWSVFLGAIFPVLSVFGVNPAAVQRYVALPTLSDAKRLLIISVALLMITISISFFMGLVLYAKYHECDPFSIGQIQKSDQIVPYFVLDVAKQTPGLSGLFIAGLFSATLSTLSTRLNVLSGTIFTDLIAPLRTVTIAEERGSAGMKIITVVVGFATVVLMFLVEKLGTLLEILLSVNGIVAGVVVGVFTMGMLFPIANAKGAFCGIIASFACMIGIGITRQMYMWNGAIKYQSKLLSTYGCNMTSVLSSSSRKSIFSSSFAISSSLDVEEPFWIFRITFFYYGFIGTSITLIIGLLISWITRKSNKPTKLELFSPFVRRFLTKSAEADKCDPAETPLQVLAININDDEN